MESSQYYQGYEIPMPDQRRSFRAPVNESFRSERDPARERPMRKSEVRKSASFHGGGRERHVNPETSYPSDEFNRLYSGKIPVFAPQTKRDIFMMDQVKEGVKEREDSRLEDSKNNRQILTSVGVGGVQFSVGFFYAATHITLVSALVQSTLLADNVNPNFHRIVFLVFSAVASCACGVLVPTARYRKLISSGAILLIFSCLSASLVTSGRFMFLPYGVIAGSAHGILRTVSMVAAADTSPSNRVASVASATLGHGMGGILGTFVYYYFMTDYLTASTWTNNFRILELTAVVALLLGSMVRRPGVMSRRTTVVLTDPGVHCVTVFYGIAFLARPLGLVSVPRIVLAPGSRPIITLLCFGMTDGFAVRLLGLMFQPFGLFSGVGTALGLLQYLIPVLPVTRDFAFSKFETFFNPLFAIYCGQWVGGFALSLTGALCGKGAARAGLFLGGVAVFLLGVAVMPHEPTYESFWAYMGLSFGQGIVTAFAQTFVTVGLARRLGSIGVGASIALLMFWQDVGTLFGILAVDNLNSDFTLDVALYMSGGVLFFAGLCLLVCCFTVTPLRSHREPFASDNDGSSSDVKAGVNNPGMGRWDGYEYDYRYMHY